MPLPPNAQPVPASPKPGVSPEEKKRQAEIKRLKAQNEAKLAASNTKARNAALKKKGNQTYDYQSIQGQTDFGAGEAGPGVPWSIKHTKTSEKSPGPPKLPSRPNNPPDWAQGRPLWPITGNVDPKFGQDRWKLAAIRRRLGNG